MTHVWFVLGISATSTLTEILLNPTFNSILLIQWIKLKIHKISLLNWIGID